MKALLFLALIAGFLILGFMMRVNINKKLRRCIELKEYEAYLNILDQFFIKLLFHPYQVEMMRLNIYLILQDHKKIDEIFSLLLSARKTSEQTQQLLLKAFVYYLKTQNQNKCIEIMEQIEKTDNEEIKKQTQIMTDTYLLKGSQYVGVLLKELENAEIKDRGPIAYLLSLQYENAGDQKNAAIYREISKTMMNSNLK